MATAPAMPGVMAATGPGGPAAGGEAPESDAPSNLPTGEQALIPAAASGREGGLQLGPLMERLPVELDVCLPVREFRVRHLLALEPGHVIESLWQPGNDVPLKAGDVQLAWSEFEAIEEHLAVRVTRLP